MIEKRTQPQSIEVNKLNESNVDDLANFPEAARAMIEKDIALIVQTSEKLRQSKTQLIDQLEELTRFKSQIEEILSSVIQEEGVGQNKSAEVFRRISRGIKQVFLTDDQLSSESRQSENRSESARLSYLLDQFFSQEDAVTEDVFDQIKAVARASPEHIEEIRKQVLFLVSQRTESIIVKQARDLRQYLDSTAAAIRVGKGGNEWQIFADVDFRAIWTPNELNQQYAEAFDLSKDLQELIGKVCQTLGLESQRYDMSRQTYFLEPVNKEEYEKLHQRSLQLANDQGYLFHSAVRPETRWKILSTASLMSRKKQMAETGEAEEFIASAAEQAGLSPSLQKSEDMEAEQVCFSRTPLASFAKGTGFGGTGRGVFSVAIPASHVYRRCGFFDSDGIHAFNLPLPEDGLKVSFADFDATIICDDECRTSMNQHSGQADVSRALDESGVPIIQSTNELGIGIDENRFVRVARIIPTGKKMDLPGEKRAGMVYQLCFD
ncbi:hypothetical protein KC921_00305 [Candidatus Woesebacteria bacterium]|nr:hypothetical protein [Candidatus Woesebacteria bacterium]